MYNSSGWEGLITNAVQFTQLECNSIIAKLRIAFPNDTFDYITFK